MTEHFVYTVRSLERMGVSAVIIEDKTGLKKNSLFGTEVEQSQDSIEHFSAKIRAGKQAQLSDDFMIIARIESLILEEPFYPLMMVKDFNSSGFAVDEKFMTLADVPTLATENVIEEPVNPFTERIKISLGNYAF